MRVAAVLQGYCRCVPTISRRSFMKRTAGAAVVAAGAPAVLAECSSEQTVPGYTGTPSPTITPQPPGVHTFFTRHEARTVEALLDQVIPGSPGVPGAREASVVTFIDQRLSRDQGVPTFTDPPYAKPYEGKRPPGPDTDQVIWVPAAQLYRYGVQDVRLEPRELYRRSLQALDAYCTKKFGSSYADLPAKQQASVFADLENDKVPTFNGDLTASTFTDVLSSDAGQGWLADPMYGGNRDMVVWKAIGYPGAQRAYTPEEMRSGHANRRPQSFASMPAAMPGMPESGVLLPEAGAVTGVEGPTEQEEFVCRTSPG
jgi:gluconate 2-dehydrogenase gamma chain